MSFQAYLDAVEDKTGHTPRELIGLADERGFDASTTAGPHRDGSDTLWLDGKATNPASAG